MDAQTNIADRKYLDPDFLAVGMEVYTYEYIEELRKQNLELKRLGKRSYNLVPQAGFQEKVLTNEADASATIVLVPEEKDLPIGLGIILTDEKD